MQSQKTYQVDLETTEAGLCDLEQVWVALQREALETPLFFTWEWLVTWWKHFGGQQQLWVLTARDAQNRLRGILPLMRDQIKLGPLPLDRLAFLGSGSVCPDHLDVVAKPGDHEPVCDAFAAFLREHKDEWDILDLDGLSENAALLQYLIATGVRFQKINSVVCPYIPLLDDWDSYAQDSLSRRERKTLRNRQRRLNRDHPGLGEFHRVTDAAELDTAMDWLIQLNLERWQDKGETSAFGRSRFAEFHHSISSVALERDWLRLYQLRVADEVVAAEYGFLYQGVFLDYQSGFSPDWHIYSPGRLLQAFAIEEAIHERAREFDLMRGAEDYKYTWTDQQKNDLRIVIPSPNLKGYLWFFSRLLREKLKSVGKRAGLHTLLKGQGR
jgi:CelD/BcsL family acetyltransferase involved in cellulose biosynthesis